MKKQSRGGKQASSGRKAKYNEPTKTISFRVPVSKIDQIKKLVISILSKFHIKN